MEADFQITEIISPGWGKWILWRLDSMVLYALRSMFSGFIPKSPGFSQPRSDDLHPLQWPEQNWQTYPRCRLLTELSFPSKALAGWHRLWDHCWCISGHALTLFPFPTSFSWTTCLSSAWARLSTAGVSSGISEYKCRAATSRLPFTSPCISLACYLLYSGFQHKGNAVFISLF